MKEGEPVRACDVRFLPIVSAYARTLGVVEEIDRLCGSKRGVSDGHIALALVLDALSGRSPYAKDPTHHLPAEGQPQSQGAGHRTRPERGRMLCAHHQ